MRGQMANNSHVDLTVVDVYDVAASIGKEFERIIDNYGPESVTELMPKVISVLENLEILIGDNQRENAEISELRFDIERLTAEKLAKIEERHKYELELEQIEDSWRKETRELVDTVGRLQDDNRKLRTIVSSQQGTEQQQHKAEEEQRMENELRELKERVHQQRVECRGLQKEVAAKSCDIEAMQNQLERMAKLNAEYKRKTTLTQQRAQNLIQEKADLQASLHDKEQQITTIKHCMNSVDSIESPASPPVSPVTTDPDCPRFTLNELKDVLTERNDLKTKLIEVEEDLRHFKPPEMSNAEEEGAAGSAGSSSTDDEERPVQGPLPKEPWEKLHPEAAKGSGIRKLFARFLEKIETIKKELDDGNEEEEPDSSQSDD